MKTMRVWASVGATILFVAALAVSLIDGGNGGSGVRDYQRDEQFKSGAVESGHRHILEGRFPRRPPPKCERLFLLVRTV